MSKISFKKALVLFFIFAAPIFYLHALTEQDIVVSVSPEVPGANQNVSINISSYGTNLDNAKITWKLDGAEKLSGNGKTDFSFTTGKAGVSSTVSITIEAEGAILNKKVTILPQNFDVLWQAIDSYTPPFYRGRALPSSESKIRVVAMPLSNDLPSTFIYQWKRDSTVVGDVSGYGKSYFDLRNNALDKSEDIEVTADKPSVNFGAYKKVTIPIVQPFINFYERTPEQGTDWAHALSGSVSAKGKNVVLVAEPFFFSPKKKNDDTLMYSWKINGGTVTPGEDVSSLTLSLGDNSSGSADVDLKIESVPFLFQEAENSVHIDVHN